MVVLCIIKERVHLKIKIFSSFTHPCVIPLWRIEKIFWKVSYKEIQGGPMLFRTKSVLTSFKISKSQNGFVLEILRFEV